MTLQTHLSNHLTSSPKIDHTPGHPTSEKFMSQNQTHFPQNLSHIGIAHCESSLLYTTCVGLFSKKLEIYRNLDYNRQRNFSSTCIVFITGDFIYVQ